MLEQENFTLKEQLGAGGYGEDGEDNEEDEYSESGAADGDDDEVVDPEEDALRDRRRQAKKIRSRSLSSAASIEEARSPIIGRDLLCPLA